MEEAQKPEPKQKTSQTKDALAKKKAAMLAKMKSKQKNFISENTTAPPQETTASKDVAMEESKDSSQE